MNIKALTKLVEFEQLKKWDMIIVKWSDYACRHSDKKPVEFYRIYQNKATHDEIICRLKGNHYFNYKMHLGLDRIGINTSQALEVWQIKEESDE
jgi:hypothetical protein